MTIDERLEALTHHTELLTRMVEDHEARWERLRRMFVAALKEAVKEDEENGNA